MWEWKFIKKYNTSLLRFRITLMNRLMLHNRLATHICISILFFLFGAEGDFVFDHFFDWEGGEWNVLIWQNMEAIELEGMA